MKEENGIFQTEIDGVLRSTVAAVRTPAQLVQRLKQIDARPPNQSFRKVVDVWASPGGGAVMRTKRNGGRGWETHQLVVGPPPVLVGVIDGLEVCPPPIFVSSSAPVFVPVHDRLFGGVNGENCGRRQMN